MIRDRTTQLRDGLASRPYLLPAGVSHADREPEAAFEVTLWRALAVFRVATISYALILTTRNFPRYHAPYAAWVVIAVMAAWTMIAISAYAFPRLRTWPLLGVSSATATLPMVVLPQPDSPTSPSVSP